MENEFRKVLVISVGKNNSIELNHAQNEFALLLKEINCEVVAYFSQNLDFKELSMGMTDDYPIAIEEGSTLIRIGSAIFGPRNYSV